MNTYEQTLADIHAHGRFSGTPSLNRIRALLAALGDPQKSLRFVHIAGTNGKGSTAALIAAALEQAGYRTGLFTSPYVVDFRERMRVDGAYIPRETLCEITAEVLRAENALALPEGERIGEFEFITACAMVYFVRAQCDIVVLEVGLGGRYDATNAIDPPEAAVMTHVALDHMAVLGNTVEAIAADKSHIVKSGSVLVNYPAQQPAVDEILRARCEAVGARYVLAPSPEQVALSMAGASCVLNGLPVRLRMLGRHQADNAATAYTALCVLRERGWRIPDEAVQAGFARASLPARQEVVQREPLLLIDGAHNPDGVRALCETLDALLPQGGISLVLGMMADKQVRECAAMLARRADHLYAVQPEGERALPSRELAALARELSPYCDVCDCGDVASGLRRALRYSGEDDVILVCGSLYVAGEARTLLAE